MTFDRKALRPPLVTEEDRQWAIDQRPAGWSRSAPTLAWSDHVGEQIERFERYFATDRKTYAEWSGLWRRKWWPRADPSIIHKQHAPSVPHPFVRRNDPAWPAVLAVLTAPERRVAERFGVAQFKPDDPRAAKLKISAGPTNDQ